MNILKKITIAVSMMLALVVPLAIPATSFAAQGIQENLCAGANLDVTSGCNSGGITDAQAQQKINDILHTVINMFSLLVGVVSVIMIIYGGLKYITSGGDSGNVSGAKNTIIYAIVGLVIVALAQFMVRFVLTKITK